MSTMKPRKIIIEVTSSLDLNEHQIIQELLEAEIKANTGSKLRFNLMSPHHLDDSHMRTVLKAAVDNTEKDAVFTIIGLTPAVEGKMQTWHYISNGRRSEMIKGLEEILENWKRGN